MQFRFFNESLHLLTPFCEILLGLNRSKAHIQRSRTHYEPNRLRWVSARRRRRGSLPHIRRNPVEQTGNLGRVPTLPQFLVCPRDPLPAVDKDPLALTGGTQSQIFRDRSRAGLHFRAPLDNGAQALHRQGFRQHDGALIFEVLGSAVFLIIHQTSHGSLAIVQTIEDVLRSWLRMTPCTRACELCALASEDPDERTFAFHRVLFRVLPVNDREPIWEISNRSLVTQSYRNTMRICLDERFLPTGHVR